MRIILSASEFLIAAIALGIVGTIGHARYTQMDTASDVALTRSNMSAVGAALEVYYIDNGAVPPCDNVGSSYVNASIPNARILAALTTPIAYTTSTTLLDPFPKETRRSAATAATAAASIPILLPVAEPFSSGFYYQAWADSGLVRIPVGTFISGNPALGRHYLFQSAGPDHSYFNVGGILSNDGAASIESCMNLFYDPTNGTVSFGSIWHFSPRTPVPTGGYQSGSGMYAAWQLTPAGSTPTAAQDWRHY